MSLTPEERRKLDECHAFMRAMQRQDLLPLNAEKAMGYRLKHLFALASDIPNVPAALESAPLSSITAPSGGATVDSQARTAINSVITALETLGLVDPN